jgi:membrane protein DedA with SNARE-associated domain
MENKDRGYYILALKIVGDVGATIAVPVVIFVIIGQYLDTKYGYGPWLTVLAFILAALTSGSIVYKKAKLYGQEYQKLGEKK